MTDDTNQRANGQFAGVVPLDLVAQGERPVGDAGHSRGPAAGRGHGQDAQFLAQQEWRKA